MIRKIYTLLILGLCLGFAACGDDNDGLDPNAAAPVINFPMEQLDVDLNKVDNLPVVAVIKSQAGLKMAARVYFVMSCVTVNVPYAPEPLACIRLSGITSRSKCASFSRNQGSCIMIGPRCPAV